ncbi:minor tail protein [Mycobacterium phage Butters]|uniref:Minor tail protein n=3 Tax=Charlievirus TaxID=1623280 RepID=A0A2Z5HEA6_9CAUD|nr:minor tail protein [Mycobacterium phage Butters]YP_010052021.1 minor tail protein [Mycobacterium phage Kevin1]AXC38481.1 minor tail protein [Mycobacterium phage Rubeelu]WAW19104.1 minor tail protein [Mycobacterium phage BIB10]WAW19166.1 minor tail protein [Mycobacterium phage BIB9]WAW19228.1 minor tail protein [Mycobacterium phage BIB8]WAW19290.1 minor tail protein [Mycobacterium phage BIB7]WAW19352.1 minor tail protein [Mycobacterium phage BIB6]WAW19414.1 minor tail protein [Mycobacteri
MAASSTDLEVWRAAIQSGNPYHIATTARRLTEKKSKVDTEFRFTVCDKMWQPIGYVGNDLMEGSGASPWNDTPTSRLVLKGNSPLIPMFMDCRNTLVGVIVETAGIREAFYTKVHRYRYENSEWTGTVELRGIWDILNYYVIWPSWWLPIQAQPFSHAVFMWALQTVLENMVAECAIRLQSGWLEFINNGLSLNPQLKAWLGTVLQALKRDGLSVDTFTRMLRTPMYVKRTNPFLDTSPMAAETVRMETVGTVIKRITRPYGVTASVDLFLPGDPQPDQWVNLDQPTYVFSTRDGSQIEGPTKTVADSVIRTVIDLGGALGGIFKPVIKQVPGMEGVFYAPRLGVDFEQPYAYVVAPEPGEDSSIISCEIADHTPEGWQHIIGGRSPKWLNDLLNATFAWAIDSLMIAVGFTGIPSDLLSGFLNNAFLAFQLIQHYERRDEVGPYHPAIERMHATASAPYNVETVFAFINALFDSQGHTTAQVTFRNGDQYALGRDIFKGGLMSLVYLARTRMITDYVTNYMWRVTPDEQAVTVQLGDGRRDEPTLAKYQRFITEAFEAINSLTLAPQS